MATGNSTDDIPGVSISYFSKVKKNFSESIPMTKRKLLLLTIQI